MEKRHESEILEEVNIYAEDCGQVKYECAHDCLGISPWLSTDK